jgi:endo-1,4-beta-xylanase
MTLSGGGSYSVTWSDCGDFTAGKGYSSGTHNMIWSGSANNALWFGVYGWLSTPLVEYYIGRYVGGTKVGTYTNSNGIYTLYTNSEYGANITGYGPFVQFNCEGPSSSPINMAEHFAAWVTLGVVISNYTPNYCIVSTEGYGSSGSSSCTVTPD